MKWQASSGADLVWPTITDSAVRTRMATALGGSDGDWLCAWCLQRVANERDRFLYNGRDEFSFSNPDGFRFEIITFSKALGWRETGQPMLEYTWFPGHAWAYCVCDRCGQHLGWSYTGPHEFVGLIKDRLVRAVQIRN